jgi:hypothetical protein
MLPVKKIDIPLQENSASSVTSFVKILGSIQGLQQRLGDFSYGEVSIAEAKVTMLVKQLSLLREKLEDVARRKDELQKVGRLVKEIPLASFDQIKLDSLEKHPQLHAILQVSKLVGATLGSGGLPVDVVKGDSTVEMPSKESPAPTVHDELDDSARPVQAISTELPNLAGNEAASIDGPSSISKLKFISEDRPSPTFDEELPTFTIPNEATSISEDHSDGNVTKDWSFDLPETALSSSSDFEFPPEVLESPKSVGKSLAQPTESRNKSTTTSSINDLPGRKPRIVQDQSAVEHPPAAPVVKSAEPKLDPSKALVPANHEFDQRLLDDVIKNYGDFTTSANLPVILASPTTPAPLKEAPANAASAQPKASTDQRKVTNTKSGDLDRQLKKIIKDYGEYDIYERKSVINLKKGGIIAFAVLGLVLVILYLFKASAAVSTHKDSSQMPAVSESIHPSEHKQNP